MARFLRSRKSTKGLAPGTLKYEVEPSKKVQTKITVISYNDEEYSEKIVGSMEECVGEINDPSKITWVNIEGLSDLKLIKEVGKKFGVHRLWLEDVLNTDHRPKISEMDDLVFVIVKTVNDYIPNKSVSFEQVSLFLSSKYLISFQEFPGDVFSAVKGRIKNSQGKIRTLGADYLLFALMDSVVDDYLDLLEQMGRKIEGMESFIAKTVDPKTPEYIMAYKTELLYLSKSALPIKEALSQILKSSSSDLSDESKKYFQDAYEHIIQVVEAIESYRQMLVSFNDFFQSRVNQRLNDIMKVLALFSAVFAPLMFIAGIYGMNFENMPELKWQDGYLYVWCLMGFVLIGMVGFIKKMKWF